MYTFTKINQLERWASSSVGTNNHKITTRPQTSHIPNEAILGAGAYEPYPIDSALNVGDWMTYWSQHFVAFFGVHISNPKSCSSLIKTATTELKQQSANQKAIYKKLDLLDPNTLDEVEANSKTNTNCDSNSPEIQLQIGIEKPQLNHPTNHSHDRDKNQSQLQLNTDSSITSKCLAISHAEFVDTDIEADSDDSQFSFSDEFHQHRHRFKSKLNEEIQQLYSHVAAISASCAQAYGKCRALNINQSQSQSHSQNQSQGQEKEQGDLEPEPDDLLINILAHQIGGIDVSVRSSMSNLCKLFLQGIMEIIDTIDIVCDLRSSGNEPLSDEKTKELTILTSPIISLLERVDALLKQCKSNDSDSHSNGFSFDDAGTEAKYYFTKIQMEALLVIIWPPSSTVFKNSLKSLRLTTNKVLDILLHRPNFLITIDWEDENYTRNQHQGLTLRDEYFLIMEQFYFENQRFSNHYNGDMHQKLNRHTVWLQHLKKRYAKKSKSQQDSDSSISGTNDKDSPKEKPKTKTKKKASQTKNRTNSGDSSDNSNCNFNANAGGFKIKYRRYRNSKDLIVDLANHLLQINNSRTKFIRLTMMADVDLESKSTLLFKNEEKNFLPLNIQSTNQDQSCKILVDILRHQISGLDIALSSEIFNSIKCFVHGMYDTSCSIMNIMSTRYYDQNTHQYLPLREGLSPKAGNCDGSGDFDRMRNDLGEDNGEGEENCSKNFKFYRCGQKERIHLILETLEMCKGIIASTNTKPNSKLKHTLLKLQLEALVLTETSPDTDIFRQYLEIMAGTAENAYHILNLQWFIPYLSICWDDASCEDQHIYYNYWRLIETCSNVQDQQGN